MHLRPAYITVIHSWQFYQRPLEEEVGAKQICRNSVTWISGEL